MVTRSGRWRDPESERSTPVRSGEIRPLSFHLSTGVQGGPVHPPLFVRTVATDHLDCRDLSLESWW